jgi:hypothetical protein
MTENVEDLLGELRRRNAEKRRRALLSEHRAEANNVVEEKAVKTVEVKEYKDMHEVASRIKGKK